MIVDGVIDANGYSGIVDAIDESDYAGTIANATGDAPLPTKTTTQVNGSGEYGAEANKGTASFNAITYKMNDLKDGGSYVNSRIFLYKITENAGSNSAIEYDDTAYYVFVTLENDPSTGVLTATPKYVEYDSASGAYTDATKLEFVNEYNSEGKANVNAIKQIIGREWTDKDSFTFTIKAYDSATKHSTV